jgi:hypothetical protein
MLPAAAGIPVKKVFGFNVWEKIKREYSGKQRMRH